MSDLSARYLTRWQGEYTPALNGEEPRMITAEDHLATAGMAPNAYTMPGKPSAATDVRGVAGPKLAGNIAGEGGDTGSLEDIAKGAARTAVELFGFPTRAIAELGAAGAGSKGIMGASQGAPAGYQVGDDLAMSADIGPQAASPEAQAKIQAVIDGAFEEAKQFVAGQPTEGADEVEKVLGFPFHVLSYPALKVGEYVLEVTGDPFLGKAAELATLTGTFKAAHAAGKIKAEDLAKLKEFVPGRLQDERGFLNLGSTKANTPEFKRWFGDSKVADAKTGEPKVVFHGTGSGFNSFATEKRGEVTHANSAKKGFFFTDNPMVAEGYADLAATGRGGKAPSFVGGLVFPEGDGFVIRDMEREYSDVFFRTREAAEKFAEKEFGGTGTYAEGANLVPVYLSMKNPLEVDFGGKDYREVSYNSIVKKAMDEGHDGAILRNTNDSVYKGPSDVPSNIYVVFKPEQVKSIYNAGKWDPSSPSLSDHPGVDALTEMWGHLKSKLLEERGSIDLTKKPSGAARPPGNVTPADWNAFEKSLRAPIEGKPGRLNYDRMAIPDSVKEVMAGIDTLYGKRIEETIGEPHTLKKVYEEAKANPMTIPELLKHPDNKPMTDVDITRARLLHGAVAAYTREAAEKVKAGDAEAQGTLDAALALTARIQEKKEATTAAIARGLGAHRVMVEVGDYQAAGLSKFAENLARLKAKGVDGKTVAEAILNMETPEQLATFARGLQKATTAQMFLEVWINGLLSGPQTHAANLTGNTAAAGVLIAERQGAALLPSWGKEPGVAMGEAGAMLHGAVLGVVDGLRLAAKTIKEGQSQFGSDKYEYLLTKNQQPMRKAITAENLSVSGPMGTFVDYLGDVIRLPGTFLGAEDALFKGMAQRMELHAQAHRRASAEGLKGKDFGKRVEELTNHPTEEMVLAASEFADYATFTKPLGETGMAAQRFLNSHPMIKVFLPFFRTPTNIMKFVGERTPLGLLSENVRSDIGRGGATGQLAVAKLVNGSLIMGTAAVLAQAGYMTGSGPRNRAQRDLWIQSGWQPYSLNIGGKYYDMSRFEPVGTLMGIAADIALINEFNQGEVDEKDIEDLAVASALAGYQAFSMKSYLAGVGSWMEAINDPDRHGGRVISQLAGSAVPSLVAQGSQAYVDPNIREVRGAVDAIMNRIPGLSDKLEPRLDLFGRERLRPGRLGPDIASPMRVSEAKEDPVLDEMNRLGMAISMPSRFVMGRRPGGSGMFGVGGKDSPWHGVELKPKEYSILVKLAGNGLREDTEYGHVGAYDYLKAAMETPEYKGLPEDPNAPMGTKQVFIKKAIYKYRMFAQEWVVENSDRLREIQGRKETSKEEFGETGKVPQIRIGQ